MRQQHKGSLLHAERQGEEGYGATKTSAYGADRCQHYPARGITAQQKQSLRG